MRGIRQIRTRLQRYPAIHALDRRVAHAIHGVRNDRGYCIRPGYKSRSRPDYFLDEDRGIVFQPDVYAEAARIGRDLGSRRMIDLGCGRGARVAELHPTYEVIGIDHGRNIAEARRLHPFGQWLEHDFEQTDALPLSDEQARGAVFICADVIEHLIHPERLLVQVAAHMALADALVVSTPERELTRGPDHLGPPPNTAHVREWTRAELGEFLDRCGLHAEISLTRAHDKTDKLETILAVVR